MACVEVSDVNGCAYCGGFGNHSSYCPTLERKKIKAFESGRTDRGEWFNRGVFGGDDT